MSISQLKYLRAVLIPVAYLFVLAISFISSNIALSVGMDLMGDILFKLYLIMGLLMVPILFIWFVWIIVSFFQDKKIRKLISMGVPIGKI